MIDYIKIGGADRPVQFGTNALRCYSGEYNVPIGKLGYISMETTNLNELIGLFYWGLKNGARVEKQPFIFDVNDVADWFDENVTLLADMFKIYQSQFVGNPQTVPETGAT